MTFKKAEVIEEAKSLQCSEPGCQNLWTVDLGRGRCSIHQWEQKQQTRSFSDAERMVILRRVKEIGTTTGKSWALALKARDEAGDRLSSLQRRYYKEALK